MSERKERGGGIVTHDLLQLVDLFRDVAKSGLHKHNERADGKSERSSVRTRFYRSQAVAAAQARASSIVFRENVREHR